MADKIISDEQKEEIAELFVGGTPQTDIAKKYKVSRTRIGQILKEFGLGGRNPWMPSIGSVRAALLPSISISDFASRLTLAENRALIVIKHHKLQDEFDQAKIRWREVKDADHQRPLIQEIKALAASLKHTPTVFDLRLGGLHLGTLDRYFGSVEEAIVAAELIPTAVGKDPAGLPPDFFVDHETSLVIERYKAKKIEAQAFKNQSPYIQIIRDLAISLGHTPRQDDFSAVGIPYTRIQLMFGSVKAAILAAGLIPNRRKHLPSPLPNGFTDIEIPDIDKDLVRKRAGVLRRLNPGLPPPDGNQHPQYVKINVSGGYQRDPKVVAWVLQEAKGFCELCNAEGYEDDNGEKFLETHHVVFLSEGGPDIVTNVVAVCETCHGKLHRFKLREYLKAEIYQKVERLRPIEDMPAVQSILDKSDLSVDPTTKLRKVKNLVTKSIQPKPALLDENEQTLRKRGRPHKGEIVISAVPKEVRPAVDEQGNPIKYRGRPRKGEVVDHSSSKTKEPSQSKKIQPHRESRPTEDEYGNPIKSRGRPRKGEEVSHPALEVETSQVRENR